MVDFEEVSNWFFKQGFDGPAFRRNQEGLAFIFRKGLGHQKREVPVYFDSQRKITVEYFSRLKKIALS